MAALPGDRSPTASELGDDVARYLEQEKVHAHPETVLEQVANGISIRMAVLYHLLSGPDA